MYSRPNTDESSTMETASIVIPTRTDDSRNEPSAEWRDLLLDALKITVLGLLSLPLAAYSQKVVQPWDNPCYNEKVEPNLELKVKTHIRGRLKDQSGAPFIRSGILIQRFPDKGKATTFKQVLTDDDGHFDFGLVSPGKYRFLPSPTRAFKQPKHADCFEGEVCELNVVLEANPTDQAFMNCPIQ
jgi:hypothetical protein